MTDDFVAAEDDVAIELGGRVVPETAARFSALVAANGASRVGVLGDGRVRVVGTAAALSATAGAIG